MTILAAHNAIVTRILAISGRPSAAVPGGLAVNALPRWVIQHSANAISTITVKGTTRAVVEVIVSVETTDGEGEATAQTHIALLNAAFPVGLHFSGVAVTQAVDPRPPLIRDGIYSVPCVIRGATSF